MIGQKLKGDNNISCLVIGMLILNECMYLHNDLIVQFAFSYMSYSPKAYIRWYQLRESLQNSSNN